MVCKLMGMFPSRTLFFLEHMYH